MNERFSVREIVCDYAIMENDEIIVIMSSRRKAEEVAKLLNEDFEENIEFNNSLLDPFLKDSYN